MEYETFSAEETEKLGEQIGREAKPGEVYTLIGDLGVGKTVFYPGNSQGFGDNRTYLQSDFLLLCRSMKKEECHFIHFDVYRIADIEEMDEIGYEDYFYGNGLTMIEWANLIEEILPDHYRQITIEKDLEKGFDYRMITIEEVER